MSPKHLGPPKPYGPKHVADHSTRSDRSLVMPVSVREPVRIYLYSVLVVGIAVLVAYGLVDESAASLWTALGAAVLAVPAVESARSRVTPVEAPNLPSASAPGDGSTFGRFEEGGH